MLSGPLDAQHCRLLREALDMARPIRPGEPVDIDLSAVSRLGVAAKVCLAAAVRDGQRTRRPLILRNVPPQAGPELQLPHPERPLLASDRCASPAPKRLGNSDEPSFAQRVRRSGDCSPGPEARAPASAHAAAVSRTGSTSLSPQPQPLGA
ncbi:hypothetical protein GCM10020369_66340 [Cryptosporangium minutisporangium]|uniref:MlaB-like STAS domain-containing protein n=1 Tax=Cryptosporangium minutisporangium TaxID=113569 RepID=A0ABP6T8B7_9ACTN